jgi:hypothetical protein
MDISDIKKEFCILSSPALYFQNFKVSINAEGTLLSLYLLPLLQFKYMIRVISLCCYNEIKHYICMVHLNTKMDTNFKFKPC